MVETLLLGLLGRKGAGFQRRNRKSKDAEAEGDEEGNVMYKLVSEKIAKLKYTQVLCGAGFITTLL